MSDDRDLVEMKRMLKKLRRILEENGGGDSELAPLQLTLLLICRVAFRSHQQGRVHDGSMQLLGAALLCRVANYSRINRAR